MTEKHPEPRNWRKLALASVVLNLFLVAVVGGHVLRHTAGERDPGPPSLARALANAEASLSPSDAAAFDAVIRRDAPRYFEAARQFEQARTRFDHAVVAEPYDPEAARQALVTWQASWNRFIDSFGNTLLDGLAQVSPEGRQKLVIQRRKARADGATP